MAAKKPTTKKVASKKATAKKATAKKVATKKATKADGKFDNAPAMERMRNKKKQQGLRRKEFWFHESRLADMEAYAKRCKTPKKGAA